MDPKTIPDGTLHERRFVWNDDCPAWPVRLAVQSATIRSGQAQQQGAHR